MAMVHKDDSSSWDEGISVFELLKESVMQELTLV
jgi:hypothetical protein